MENRNEWREFGPKEMCNVRTGEIITREHYNILCEIPEKPGLHQTLFLAYQSIKNCLETERMHPNVRFKLRRSMYMIQNFHDNVYVAMEKEKE